MSQVRDVNLLRYLERDSAVHRLWGGTKIVGVIAVGVAISFKPTWPAEGITAALIATGMVAGRIPLGALPRFPRWFLLGVGLTAVTALFSGGSPVVHAAGFSIGLGGLDEWARFLVAVALLILLSALLGWTTRTGEMSAALATLLAPARWVRFPVDEAVVVSALAVRCLPMLIDELRTLYAARRVRRPPTPDTVHRALGEAHDILSTALVSAVRRAEEMTDAIYARGGMATVVRSRPRLRTAEVLAWLVIAVVTAGVVVV